MISRFIAFVILVWMLGFLWFAIFLPQPEGEYETDAVVVFTGGEGRIDRGLEVLKRGWSSKLLVSGVGKDVREHEFRAEYGVSRKLMRCCVTLDFESTDTIANSLEASIWLAEHNYETVRLVTSDWHMRRAAYELDRVRPGDVAVIRDAVHTQPSLRILFLEYHKLLARLLPLPWFD